MVPRRLPDLDGVELLLLEGRGTEEEHDALAALLSEDERVRAARFRLSDVRNSFVLSRGVLRQILGAELNCVPESLEFGEGEHGKPFLAGMHLGCEVEFNLAHSGDVILYAVSRGRVVGVDVERKKEDLDVEKLARRYFAPDEARRLLDDAPVQERIDNFFRCWTRKEAYLKARGTGLTTKLDAFEVTLRRGVAPAVLHTEVGGEDPADWKVFEVPVPEGYEAALVVGR